MRALAASAFLRGTLKVGVADHVYICGRQFMNSEAATFRACDTAVFVLQTAAAAKRWPTTKRKLDELRSTFHQTNGTRTV